MRPRPQEGHYPRCPAPKLMFSQPWLSLVWGHPDSCSWVRLGVRPTPAVVVGEGALQARLGLPVLEPGHRLPSRKDSPRLRTHNRKREPTSARLCEMV